MHLLADCVNNRQTGFFANKEAAISPPKEVMSLVLFMVVISSNSILCFVLIVLLTASNGESCEFANAYKNDGTTW